MSSAENHARLDDMGGDPFFKVLGDVDVEDAMGERIDGRTWAEAAQAEEPPLAAATVMAALVQLTNRLEGLTEQLAEGFATVLARQRVQADQLTEFQAMLAEFRPLLDAARKRMGAPGSWRERFATGGGPGGS